MGGGAAFVIGGLVLGALAVGAQWLVPLIERDLLHHPDVVIPGAHGAVWFCLLVPLLFVLVLLVALFASVCRAVGYSQRKAARARRGPANYVPFSDHNAPEEIARLRQAFVDGTSRPPAWRRQQLLALLDMTVEHETAILESIAQDLHKCAPEALITELLPVRNELLWLADHVDELAAPTRVRSSASVMPSRSYVYHDPLGVVFVIGTWNLPFGLSILPLAGAIAGGNCCVVKFAPASTHFGPLMCSLLPKYLDMRCFALECVGGPEVVQAVLAQPLDLIFFTGSERVGRIILGTAARQMCPVVLELGGKNPVIIDRTADMHQAAKRIAWAKGNNAGQTCIAPDYILCVAGDGGNVAGRLISELRTAFSEMYGADAEAQKQTPFFGRLINVAAAERLAQMIEANRDKVVYGGQYDVQQRFVAPTIVLDPPVDSLTLMQEEIFGPVLPVINVPTLGDAIRIATSHGKPLALYVYSRDTAVQDRVLRETQSGAALVNDCSIHYSNPHLPFGGVGTSGMGRYHGEYTFKTFVHERAVVRASWLSRFVVFIRVPPFSPLKTRVVRVMLQNISW